MSKFDELYESIMDLIKNNKRIEPRYDGTNLKDARGLRQDQSTKYNLFNQYKRRFDRGDNIYNPSLNAGVLNKSKKSLNRIKLNRGLDALVARLSDGRRTTNTVGKKVNSKTDNIVKRILPNGDVIAGRPVRTNFER